MKSRIFANAMATLAGLVALGALVPTTARAQTACYVPGSGTVYRIKEPNTPTQCSTGHVEFQLSSSASVKPGSGGATGAAGGDLGGSYPNPSVVRIQGQPISTAVPTAGQILTFNSGAWTPAAPLPTLPMNNVGSYNFSNINGLVAAGNLGNGVIPMSGAGVRMMWYPNKAAFRAGQVEGTQWDAASIGLASVGLGKNTTASGDYSVSIGSDNVASAYHASALGFSGVASGIYSTAIGTFATASGSGSVAIGSNSLASATEAIAIGAGAKATGSNSLALGYANTSGMSGTFVYGDGSSFNTMGAPLDNSFVVRAQHFWLGTTSSPTAPAGQLIATSTGAYLSTGGTWTNSSDSTRKHAFQSVDGESLLARIDAMPVSTWSYKTESDSVRHMGPTAQDFRKAFGLGDTDKAIATVDADGVSLAAVKALIARTSTLSKENSELRQRTTDLSKQNEELRSMMAELAQRLQQIEQARR